MSHPQHEHQPSQGKQPSRFKRWLGTQSEGEKFGLGCCSIALAIPILTAAWLILQALLDGGCGSECVARGWYGVFAVWAAVPAGIIGLIIYAIATGTKKPK
jgi:hypothetical protein